MKDVNKTFRQRLYEATFDDEDSLKRRGSGKRPYLSTYHWPDDEGNVYRRDDIDNPEEPIAPRYKHYNNTSWLIPDLIIRSARPGYPDEDFQDDSIVDEWLDMVYKETGTKPKTIITFLDDLEIADFYNFDLIKAYEDRGIKVHRVPTEDPVFKSLNDKSDVFSFAQLKKIVDLIRDSDKPVLIHCSAGIDRTGYVSRYLQKLYGGMNKKKEPYSRPDNSDPDQIEKFRKRYGKQWG